jgi:hypothetical protein
MNKPYHERPDWILKSIVYFCDNYTIGSKDLQKYKRGAIETLRKAWEPGLDINTALPAWGITPQGFTFWDCLAYLSSIELLPDDPWPAPDCGATCKPWTNYEKRKIAKMPEVK